MWKSGTGWEADDRQRARGPVFVTGLLFWVPRKTSRSEKPVSLNQQLTTVISVKSGVFRCAFLRENTESGN